MIEQHYNIVGKNKFYFKIISISKNWAFKGYEVLVDDNDVYISTPTTGKDKGYYVTREEFYMSLFNLENKISSEEFKKVTLSDIRVAANVNPEFLRDLVTMIYFKKFKK